MSNERPTEHLILTGNIFKDSVDNLVEILRRLLIEDPDQKLTYMKRVIEVYGTDIAKIGSTPIIAVSWENFTEVVRTIGKRYPVGHTINNYINVYYYHEQIKNEIRKEEIRDALWELTELLRQNSDANGLSAEGATIEEGQLMNRIRNDIPYSGGLVRIKLPVQHRTRRGVS